MRKSVGLIIVISIIVVSVVVWYQMNLVLEQNMQENHEQKIVQHLDMMETRDNAGPDLIVNGGDLVALDGSTSSGNSLVYSWAQIAGPYTIPLINGSSANPIFTAPLVSVDSIFSFQLTVTDSNDVQSNSDIVDVAVCSKSAIADPGGFCDHARVDVRARHLKDLSLIPVYHLFIIYADQNGTEYYYRGGWICQDGTRLCDLKDMIIVGNKGLYVKDSIDWDTSASSITILKGKPAQNKDTCFSSELDKISLRQIPYKLLDQNSNSVARTLLENCSVPAEKPVKLAVGWDTILTFNMDHTNE